MTTYYELLEITIEATAEDVRKSYKRLALVHHPDKGGDAIKFQQINSAYETLSDPDKRNQYNESLRQPQPPQHNYEDFIHMFTGHATFRPRPPQHHAQPLHPKKLDNEELVVNVSIREALQDINKHFHKTIGVICNDCIQTCLQCKGNGIKVNIAHNGFFAQQIYTQCPDCNHKGIQYLRKKHCTCDCGKIVKKIKIHLSVPKQHILNGVTRFDKLGKQPTNKLDSPGDFTIKVKVNPTCPDLTIDLNGKITYTPTINVVDAVKGFTIPIPEELTINSTTEATSVVIPVLDALTPDYTYIVSKKGMFINDTDRADLIIKPKIDYMTILYAINNELLAQAFSLLKS